MTGKALGFSCLRQIRLSGRLLALGLLTSVLCPLTSVHAADYALAYRPGIAVTETPWPQLEKSIFDATTTWLNGQLNGSSMTDFSPEREDAVILSPCLTLNGAGDYVDTGLLSTNTSLTYLALIEASDQGAYSEIMGDRDGAPTPRGSGLLFHDGYNRPYFASSLGTSLNMGVSGGWVANGLRWVAGIISVEGTNTVVATYYPHSGYYESKTYAGTIALSSRTIKVGSRGDIGESFPYFSGRVADVRYFDRALTTNEIDEVITTYNCGNLCYPLTEGSGLTAYDVSGNGNHGTITTTSGTVWDGVQTNSPYAAEYGASRVMSFNGTTSQSDTGIAPNQDTELEIKFIPRTVDSNVRPAAGLQSGTDRFFVGTYKGRYYAGFNNNSYPSTLPAATANVPVVMRLGKTGIYVNGNLEESVSTNDWSTSTTIMLGRRNPLSSYGDVDIIYCKVWQDGVLISDYTAANAYGTTLPDNVGTNNATLVNVDLVNIPALSDGTDDAAGLGITNPKGLAHNNGGYSLIFGGATNSYANLLTNSVNIVTNDDGLITEVYE